MHRLAGPEGHIAGPSLLSLVYIWSRSARNPPYSERGINLRGVNLADQMTALQSLSSIDWCLPEPSQYSVELSPSRQ